MRENQTENSAGEDDPPPDSTAPDLDISKYFFEQEVLTEKIENLEEEILNEALAGELSPEEWKGAYDKWSEEQTFQSEYSLSIGDGNSLQDELESAGYKASISSVSGSPEFEAVKAWVETLEKVEEMDSAVGLAPKKDPDDGPVDYHILKYFMVDMQQVPVDVSNAYMPGVEAQTNASYSWQLSF